MESPGLSTLFDIMKESKENNSITKKYLTKELVERYKDTETSFGGTLALCVKHNANNPGALLPRCADFECYEVFSEFFDAVIRDYHKLTTSEISHPPSDFGDLVCLPFADLGRGDMIASTRVRLGRTVKGYGFAPVITKEERLQLEEKISNALKALPGEYAGTYYPLSKMSAEDHDQLVADHFLFRDDDSVLRDAGGYRDWPSGRGIFLNNQKNFIVWVNEEDHIRIISMQPGGNLTEVYKRLAEAVKLLSNTLDFVKDDRLGYLTFCPSNLGTTLRASVHAIIPMISSLPNFKDICEKCNIQSRGTFGEHTENVSGIFDLSNKSRLGLTEVEAVTQMTKGVKELLTLETLMETYNKDMPATTTPIEPLCYLAQLICCNAENRSLSKKHLTSATIKEFENLRTSYGTTLGHCLRNCAYNPSALCLRVGDCECYTLFNKHIDAIIREYHKIPGIVICHPPPDFGDLYNLPFDDLDPSGQYIISTRVRVGRNCVSYQFGPTISKESRLKLEVTLSEAFKSLTNEHAGAYYPLEAMEPTTQKQLIDDHFLFKDDDPIQRDAGGYRDWPFGRGIFRNSNKTFLCWVGEEDHLRIISMQDGGDLASVYTRLIRGIQAIEAKVSFYHSDTYGYLTCCPTNLGTTMRASVHIRVPKLSQDKAKFDSVCDKYGLQARGIQGEHTESVDGVYDLSNERRLGLTEIDAASEMARGVGEIIKIEASLE